GAVLLDHHIRDLVDALVGGEAAAARQALAASPDDHAVLPFARVDDLVLDVRAEGAFHPCTCAIRRTSAGRTPSCHMNSSPRRRVGTSVTAGSVPAAAPALPCATPQNPAREPWQRNSYGPTPPGVGMTIPRPSGTMSRNMSVKRSGRSKARTP